MTIGIGAPAPGFELPAVGGGTEVLDGVAAPATVVYWTCNHCPYALAWHGRMLAVADDYADRGVRVLAINSNNAISHPADSFEKMVERVEAEGGWSHPYLRDESQEVARAWGATTTPDVFLLDGEGRLRYRGAPDSDYDDPTQEAAFLRDALDAVLAGNPSDPAETPPVGCSIKWL